MPRSAARKKHPVNNRSDLRMFHKAEAAEEHSSRCSLFPAAPGIAPGIAGFGLAAWRTAGTPAEVRTEPAREPKHTAPAPDSRPRG
jgi:hypothetical protein